MAEDYVPARSALSMTFGELPASQHLGTVVASGTAAGSRVLTTPAAGVGGDPRVVRANLAATAVTAALPMPPTLRSSSPRPSREPSLTRGEATYPLGHDLVAAA